MLKKVMFMVMAAAVAANAFAAQAKPAAAQARPAAAKPETKAEAKPEPAKAPPEPPALPVNIKIEVSITDQSGTNPPARKVVTMIASDRQPTNVRSTASVPIKTAAFSGPGVPATSYTYKTVQINVDARPAIVQKEPNKVSVNFGLEYLPTSRVSDQEGTEAGLTSWNERLSVILESGKPMVISQAADPTSDRKISVEITATILK
jgi:hypothetical protein